MGDRYLYQDQRSANKAMVEVLGKVAIGASGAVGAITGKGFSIVHTGTGVYTVTFQDRFPAVLQITADAILVSATPSGSNPYWATPGPFTQASGTTPATLVINVWNPGGSALQDPASGGALEFAVTFQNSSVP